MIQSMYTFLILSCKCKNNITSYLRGFSDLQEHLSEPLGIHRPELEKQFPGAHAVGMPEDQKEPNRPTHHHMDLLLHKKWKGKSRDFEILLRETQRKGVALETKRNDGKCREWELISWTWLMVFKQWVVSSYKTQGEWVCQVSQPHLWGSHVQQ